jgi:hypothetical protein
MRSPTSALLGAAWREDLAGDDNREFPKCSHDIRRSYTVSLPGASSVPFNSLNRNVIASVLGSSPDVCDNLILTARKLLILKTERWASG